jgi:hypothetical protein
MTWQNEMVRIVRFLVNDLDASSYPDSRLEETILVAAQLINPTIDFDNTYTIDVDTIVLTPDPTQLTTKDDWFINLVCLKTACIILGSETKTLSTQSYKIVDGPSTIDAKGVYDANKTLYDELCEQYDRLVLQYRAGNSVAGQAILTPYTQERVAGSNPIRNFS